MAYKKGLITTGYHLPYNQKLKQRARELRNNMTRAESLLRHKYLRHLDIVVLRQKIIDHYIVDFYIASKKLVIELDGDTHYIGDQQEYDANRDTILASYGLKILRFTNQEIYNNLDAVCATIENNISSL